MIEKIKKQSAKRGNQFKKKTNSKRRCYCCFLQFLFYISPFAIRPFICINWTVMQVSSFSYSSWHLGASVHVHIFSCFCFPSFYFQYILKILRQRLFVTLFFIHRNVYHWIDFMEHLLGARGGSECPACQCFCVWCGTVLRRVIDWWQNNHFRLLRLSRQHKKLRRKD